MAPSYAFAKRRCKRQMTNTMTARPISVARMITATVDGELKRAFDGSTFEGVATVGAVEVANALDPTFVGDVAVSMLMVGRDALAKLLTMVVIMEVMLVGVTVFVSARIPATCELIV